MLLSHAKKFIYIKTVKTAGTSVEVALQEHCLPPDRQIVSHEPYESDYGIVGARGQGARAHTWFNHMPARAIRKLIPEDTWESYTKICNIRNPWDKTVSWFHFAQPEMKSRPRNEVISAFRRTLYERLEANLNFGRDTNLYFIDGQPVCNEYIRYDRLQDDYARICRKLDIKNADLPQLKRTERGSGITYREYYDNDLRDHVAEAYSMEINVFGWSF
ncbi:hypothetical protein OG2516_18935 [Oceanicola granulosus HTCC2516]|uniref:Sulfotransferase family protein n=1 Tax=Oceanicola granulosus (strain ATCC BAA-861 / DSM 15982 / KCTC 12143 / HTCC2516) TaxID=314256 RepID=Q2CBT1_OCEGH|nr:hypothetical protein [Oceanicola granulosus]EAR50123.1 hypothetical protein OG2516_18935 [Oceanicola granulosus HTCC2516]